MRWEKALALNFTGVAQKFYEDSYEYLHYQRPHPVDVLPTDDDEDILTWEIHSIRADASNSSACQSLKVHVVQCTITLVIQLDKITPSKTPEKPHRDFQGGVPPFFLFSSLCVAGSCLCSPCILCLTTLCTR